MAVYRALLASINPDLAQAAACCVCLERIRQDQMGLPVARFVVQDRTRRGRQWRARSIALCVHPARTRAGQEVISVPCVVQARTRLAMGWWTLRTAACARVGHTSQASVWARASFAPLVNTRQR